MGSGFRDPKPPPTKKAPALPPWGGGDVDRPATGWWEPLSAAGTPGNTRVVSRLRSVKPDPSRQQDSQPRRPRTALLRGEGALQEVGGMRAVQREREAERETPTPRMREKRKAERQTAPQREARGEREQWMRSQMRTEPQRGRRLAERDRETRGE